MNRNLALTRDQGKEERQIGHQKCVHFGEWRDDSFQTFWLGGSCNPGMILARALPTSEKATKTQVEKPWVEGPSWRLYISNSWHTLLHVSLVGRHSKAEATAMWSMPLKLDVWTTWGASQWLESSTS